MGSVRDFLGFLLDTPLDVGDVILHFCDGRGYRRFHRALHFVIGVTAAPITLE
ncbi:hypothetical protein OF001_U10500 [Pseudomonas sp. OF001]|nr:hypothetical protein OF001_U10500 [Pseudomonas sp. OF001]